VRSVDRTFVLVLFALALMRAGEARAAYVPEPAMRADSAHTAATRDSMPASARAAAAQDSARAFARRASALDSALIVAPAADSGRAVDYLWVVRTALLRRSDIAEIVARAKAMGVRGLLVQVVGRGDAYYHSSLLPVAEALAPALRDDPDYDPLGEIVNAGHAAGLEVHAWMNCMLVWSAAERPSDAHHVVNAHPEWIACTAGGRRLSRLSVRERVRLGLEGVFLAPANPGVRRYVAGIAAEIARRYAVDGIQLDYIRQPSVAVGYDADTRMRFALEYHVDPVRRVSMSGEQRAVVDSQWQSFQRERVTAIVHDVRDSLNAVRPGITLSAAVLADTIVARIRNAQDWAEWVREGMIDRAFAMCYAAPVQTVMDQMTGYAEALGLGGRVVPGIAVFNTGPAQTAAKLLGARALGFPLLALYSYDSLEEYSSYWSSLRDAMSAAGRGRP
jgi:uncharacterized lipoprotein YddW (UPF0748 family)